MIDFENCSVLAYAAISIGSMVIGYAFSVSTIMKQCEDITELRVQILEILNRERMLLDEYRDFVLDTKKMNQQMKNLVDSVETKQ